MDPVRMCEVCRAAENPKSKLRFHDTPSGVLCDGCYERRYFPGVPGSPLKGSETPSQLVVVHCPPCGGSGRREVISTLTETCRSCLGYGSVRVAANAIPVYRPFSGPPAEQKAKEPSA